MDALWTWLEMLPLATRIGESAWFPFLESIHVLTAMFLVGAILFVDLRLLGLAAMRYPMGRFIEEVLPWAWVSFMIALISGLGMFITRASAYVGNRAFQLKLIMLVIAAINMLYFHRWSGADFAASQSHQPAFGVRLVGAISLAAWIGATLAGRWTGHLS
jgi:hypothetical protein